MIARSDVHDAVGRWWIEYDEANFDAWPALFTDDVHFTCRTDTGTTDYEEFVRADLRERDAVLAWQVEHRKGSPYPLRHHGINVHVTATRATEADFSSYIFVTQILQGQVSNLSTALVTGTVRDVDGTPQLAALHVVLDTRESEVFSARTADAQAGSV